MPAKTTKSVLGSQVDPHIKAHANDETSYGIIRLPAGIVNGVAKLQECYFAVHEQGKKNAGKIYWRAMAVVVSPASVGVNGSMVPIKNLQTSIILPWDYARGKDGTVEESKARVMNELRKLAGEEATNACSTGQDLEALCKAIEEAGPYVRFSTSESKPQTDPATGKAKLNPETGKPYEPQVWENWHGTKGLENYGEEHAPTPGIPDNTKTVTKAEASVNGTGHYRDDEDLDSLAKRAKTEEAAGKKLRKWALDLGYTEEEVDDDDTSWEDIVGWIRGGEKPTTVDEDTNRIPKIDDAVKYSPPSAKGGKAKPVDCQVIKINRKEKTVELARLDDRKKTFPSISWDELDYE